jgi:hypothetical protein
VADGSEDDVCGVALAAFEMAAAEVAIALHVSDDGFNSRAAARFALDDAEDAALLTRDEDATRIGRVVAAIALVDIGALDRAAGELFGGLNDAAERMPVIRVAWQRLGVEHELATGGAGVGRDDRGFDADLWTTALQEESTKGSSGLRQSRVQFLRDIGRRSSFAELLL